MLKTSFQLGLFAIIAAGLLAITYQMTKKPIAINQEQATRAALNQIIPADQYNNNIVDDAIEVTSADLLGSTEPLPLYTARLDGQPMAVILTVIAPNGYNGAIQLLVGVTQQGSISGVRVIAHQETPGLGDKIETANSDWIYSFNNESLNTLNTPAWRVMKDGGAFEQWTGATITPRAVVEAVHNALLYVQQHHDALFRTNDGDLDSN